MISRSLGTSQKYAALLQNQNGIAEFCHALFPLLVVNADDCGRLQGDAFTVKYAMYPISQRTVEEFESALVAMHGEGLIARYMAGLHWFIQIINFKPHQPGLLKEIKTQFPAPDAAARAHILKFSRNFDVSEPSREFPRIPANSRESGKVLENAGKLPRIPSKEGRKEGRSISRSSGYLARSGTLETPLPPLKGGKRKKQRLPGWAKKRLAEAEAVGAVWKCQHEPKCHNTQACKLKVIGRKS